MRKPLSCITVLAALLLLSGCHTSSSANSLYDPADPNVIDPDSGLKRKDYEDMLKPPDEKNVSFKTKGAEGPPIPDLAPILAEPEPPQLGQTKLVSITVTDDVPLKDVLMELARLADVDMEVDANIVGGVSFRAKDRPFNEVIERIADLAGLRYTMKDGVLRIERDTPYVEVYPLDFINIERSSNSSINISTNVLSNAGAGGGGGGLNSGSSASVSATSSSDFWKQFDDGIKQILSYKPASRLSTASDSSSQATAAATPATGSASAAKGRPGASGASDESKPFYNINRQGSTLTVSASERQQKMIKRFLKQIEANASAQVLIEAKIMEVTLDKEFQAGIDWSKLGGSNVNLTTNFGSGSVPSTETSLATFSANGLLRLPGTGTPISLDSVAKLAESFGTTRTLASPRLHAINNQQAVLTFAQNQVYFQLNVTQSTLTTVGASTLQSPLTVNSTIKTVPIGVILTMQPSINLETNEITLDVRPTLSKIVGQVTDPAVAFLIAQAVAQDPTQAAAFAQITSTVPIVEVRELDSILKLKSGDVMVIGGLMQDISSTTDSGIPFVDQVPVVGQLFQATNRSHTEQELVIFIRATITGPRGSTQDADKAVYKKFMTDPRPLNF